METKIEKKIAEEAPSDGRESENEGESNQKNKKQKRKKGG